MMGNIHFSSHGMMGIGTIEPMSVFFAIIMSFSVLAVTQLPIVRV